MTQLAAADTVALATAPGQRLRADAAAAWDAAARECQATHGWTPTLTDSYRPYATQERIFLDRYRPGRLTGQPGYTADVRYWNGQPWTRRSGTAAAAVPGTSNHGGGIAVDAGRDGRSFATFTDPARAAFLAIAARHGWSDAEGRSVAEPWHLTFHPERNTTPAPAPIPTPQEDDMPTPYDVWAYKAPKVNGTADAYSLLTAIFKRKTPEARDVWAYKNKKVNGERDAYSLLTGLARDVAALRQEVATLRSQVKR